MRKYLFLALITLLFFSFSPSTLAHDGWAQTNSPIIEVGETAYIELLFGNHTNEHASYRIEGTWNPDNSSVFVTAPTGDKIDITDTLFYTGETAEGANEERIGVNNYYVSSFSSSTPGAYVISVEGDAIFRDKRTLRSAKSFVAVSEVPIVSYVQDFTGFDKQVSPDRAEIVPLFNPAGITPDQEVSVQVFIQGEPLADTEVSLVRRSTSDAERFTTDENGVITFTTGPADYYLLRVKPSTEESVEGEYEATYYEATMSFVVQNGTGSSTAELDTLISSDQVQQGNSQTSPFLYVSIFLALALIASLIFKSRKK
ncbi:DUF4198 domain-containing protein [Alkalihalobacillus sp. BA299]|uniref:DUF4198 domain-containing protein n=1 Tax=Alkalihalobacillus sp. BA299 TaxID=2815938 RepID=UPI001ADB79BA|nr:DUF4198 domain-containing protein [Alkalihalobacillus sp. BA299]